MFHLTVIQLQAAMAHANALKAAVIRNE